jgi:hypothetical protein
MIGRKDSLEIPLDNGYFDWKIGMLSDDCVLLANEPVALIWRPALKLAPKVL